MSGFSAIKDTSTLVAKDVVVNGNINGNSTIELEGNVSGNVFCNVLTIRETGLVKGELRCKVINIKGNFIGNAFSEKINISETAKVDGILEYKFLSVESGANINCELKRVKDNNNQSIAEQKFQEKNLKTQERIEIPQKKENKI